MALISLALRPFGIEPSRYRSNQTITQNITNNPSRNFFSSQRLPSRLRRFICCPLYLNVRLLSCQMVLDGGCRLNETAVSRCQSKAPRRQLVHCDVFL